MKAGAAIAGVAALTGTATSVAADDIGEPVRSSAPVDMFLEIDGIEGESRDHAHEGEIEILSWSWGASQSGSTQIARGGGAGKVSFQDLNVTKRVDKSTPALWMAVASGKHVPRATLTIRKAGGDESIDFLVLELENVLVTSFDVGGASGEEQTETVTLNFAQFKVTYTPQAADGSPLAPVGPVGWNIQRNEPV